MKRILAIVAANLLVLAFGLILLEVATRTYDYGSVVSGLASFVRDEPSRFGSTSHQTDWLVTDPDLGYRLNPEGNEANSIGIRGPEPEVPKPPDRFRVAVLGDSVAWDDDGFVTLLAERWASRPGADVEVINASIPGYTTYQERVLLERDILSLEPDLVLVQYCLNDNHRFLHYIDPAGQWLVTEEAQALIHSDGDGWLAWLTRTSSLVRQLRLAFAGPRVVHGNEFLAPQSQHFGTAWQDEPWAATEQHLRAMRDAAAERGARFALVMAPIREQIVEDWLDWNEAYVLEPQERMATFAEEERIPLLDLHPVLRGHDPDAVFRDLLHFTPEAHQLVAPVLDEFLQRNRLGPSN